MKRILRKTSRIGLFGLIFITLLIAAGIVIGNIYKDGIRNYIISEINNEIELKLNVKSAEFSVLRKFPFISIVLTDVTVLSGKDIARSQFSDFSADTLFIASRIYLQFNLLDILKKEYRLRRVHAVDGKINILVDRNGRVNYRIFKENQGEDEASIALDLDGVKISKFSWEYRNLAKSIHSEGIIRDISLKGKFSHNDFSMNSLSAIFISTFNREGIEYASNLEIVSRLILKVQDTIFNINKGELTLNKLKFYAGGSLTHGAKTDLNLQVTGKNLDINSLIAILPFNAQTIRKYSPAGTTEILAKFRGEISSIAVPSIQAAFKVSDGKILLNGNRHINGIKLKGTYSNGSRHNASTSRIILTEYLVNYENNQINGKFTIDNFNNPFLSASLSGSILAKELSDILKIDGLNLYTGFIYPDLSLNLTLDSFSSFKIHNISANGLHGKMSFKEISGELPFSDLPLQLLEGNIFMDGETWRPEFKVKLGKNDISANLVVNNMWQYFVNKSIIPEINGEVYSTYFSLSDFLPKSDPKIDTNFQMPDSINLNLHCEIDSFRYGKFLASDLETWFTYKPRILSVSSLKMQTMRGKISVSGVIIADNQGLMLLRTSGELRNIDINKLFYTFNNFWQSFIVADNLKGSVTGKIDFSATISPELVLLSKNLVAQSDFVIEEGELIKFEPITELSSFVELTELKHIKFSTLKNSILIKDEKVYIPQMDINSSAFNISISGIHGFDNFFEYKLKLNMSEILAGKARKAKKENEEFGIIEAGEAGNTNLYLSITGTPDSFKIRYDKKEAIIQIKNDLKKEKKLLKSILREELGLFKKDSINTVNKTSNTDQKQFIMDWGDEKNNLEEPVNKPKNKKMRKKDPDINITWEEEDPDL